MKKIIFILTIIFSLNVQAKYIQPEGVATLGDKNARYQFNYLDTKKIGKITLEQYKNKRVTRDVRRQIKKDKDEGKYLSPEQEFNQMDTDQDGFITESDLAKFLNEKK